MSSPDFAAILAHILKDPAMIRWADGRAAFGVVPEFIQEWL